MVNLIEPTDLSLDQLNEILALALDIIANRKKYAETCRGKKLATLFYEPSTRTRLSFTAAMMELGGNVLGFSDAGNSSVSKGETVADTTKVISCFADIIAMRHFEEGAALVAALNSRVPVINAGDGSHAHPTQTLTDLLTILREIGRLDNLTVGFCGDLKFGRTVHSLIKALSRHEGFKVVLIAPEQLRLPDYVKHEVCELNGIPYVEVETMEEVMPQLDVLYMTRVQKERFTDENEYEMVKDTYILTPDKIANAKTEMRILHPLPRVNEIAVEVDADPRAAYFRQVENGKFVRMALILKLLEWAQCDPDKAPRAGEPACPREQLIPADTVVDVYTCSNPRCISNMENVPTLFRPAADDASSFRCLYCESRPFPAFLTSV